MKLHDDWKKIVKKAWSFRFIIIAAILSGAEVALPYLADKFPSGVFASLSFVFTMMAMIARVVAQPKMDNDNA